MILGKILKKDNKDLSKNIDYKIAIAGNPNVGKSTIFNSLTGMHQHTGNWPGKTVDNARGVYEYKNNRFLLVDIPGTYSIMANSEEEEIARDFICFQNPDVTVIVVDATSLGKSLNLVYQIMEITPKIIVCVNLLDEAKKKGIIINLKKLEEILGVPVVGTVARKKKTLFNLMEKIYLISKQKEKILPNGVEYPSEIENEINILEKDLKNIIPLEKLYLARWISIKLIDRDKEILSVIEENLKIDLVNNINIKKIQLNDVEGKIVSTIIYKIEDICKNVITYKDLNYNKIDKKIDKILTSKIWGIPIMLAFLGIILWITIIGANYPSEILSKLFASLKDKLVYVFDYFEIGGWIKGIFIDGIYSTLTWIIAVMLPPMAIFFPLFTILEDLGFLPRIAFNLDKYLKKAGSSRKTSINHVYGIWL